MEEVRDFHKSHETPPSGEHSLRYYGITNPNQAQATSPMVGG
jgi:hypothetical protein